MNNNYLIHFGNKNSGRYKRGSGERPHQHDGLGNPNYSSKQYRRDESIYGHRAAKRINKATANGESLQGARHREVVRRDNRVNTKKVAKNIAKAGMTVGSVAAVYGIAKKYGNTALSALDASTIASAGNSIIKAILRV